MFDVLYPGRRLVIDSPLSVEEVTHRLGREPVGTRIHLHLQLHWSVLAFGVLLAVVGGAVAALAAPELPVVTNSPLMARFLVMAAVVVLFAAVGNLESRIATRLLKKVVGAVLLIGTVAVPAAASQAPGGAPADKPKISACSLLTRELVEKVTTGNKETLKYLKPQEQPIGTHGSFCDYGLILQVDPFLRTDDLRTSPPKDWQRVTGVGDTAYFRNNANRFAELIVWTGSHHFTVQIGAPAGSTVDSVRPNTIALANAIIPKLR